MKEELKPGLLRRNAFVACQKAARMTGSRTETRRMDISQLRSYQKQDKNFVIHQYFNEKIIACLTIL
jgi:hypothetical protein